MKLVQLFQEKIELGARIVEAKDDDVAGLMTQFCPCLNYRTRPAHSPVAKVFQCILNVEQNERRIDRNQHLQ